VPTALERQGNFPESTQATTATAIRIYDPVTGSVDCRQQPGECGRADLAAAQALLNSGYYPLPNIPPNAQGYNYQTISNGGNNNVAINTRYVRTLGGSTTTPFGNFGGGGGQRRRKRQHECAALAAAEHQPGLQLLALGQRQPQHLSAAGRRDGERRQRAERGLHHRLWAALQQRKRDLEPLNAKTRNYFTDTANNPRDRWD
jgi:hypothetical protein